MKKKFESEYFDTAHELAEAKNDAWSPVEQRRERLKIIRDFTNMLNTMTEEEAEALGRTEITNHGLNHRDMLQQETQYSSMVTVTNSLLDIVVDTDNAEKDAVTGLRISEAINRYAVHHKGRFSNLWKRVSGELVIAGGCPVTYPEKYGWLPDVRIDMFFPRDTKMDASEIPYAFDPKELTLSDLEKLSRAVATDSPKYIDKEAIDALITEIKEQIRDNSKTQGASFSQEITKGSIDQDQGESNTSIAAYWYYEIKRQKNGDDYVSATLFIDGVSGVTFKGDHEGAGTAKIIAYIDKCYAYAPDWLHFVAVDSEIGGVKNIDTLRGVAEMVYPSSLETEELLNIMLEGDKQTAKPKYIVTDKADPEAIAKFDAVADTFVPEGIEEMVLKSNTRGLQTPLSLLSQNTASMSGGAVSNGPDGGELRQQAVERQQNAAMVQANRVSEAYNHLESVLETMVWRILAGPTKPGTAGYHEIMCVREKLEAYGIPFKDLATRKYGKFQYIRVRVSRTVGNGDRQQQIDTADWLLNNIGQYPPGSRPMVLHQATLLRTQDPDRADALVKVPQAILNAQKVTAENEYDTIKRRAALGQILPVADDDIHQDHIPVHLVDMQAHIATHEMRPWDKLDVMVFAGVVQHVGEHLKILMANPVTNPEGVAFIQDYQNITQAAQRIVAEVEERAQQEEQGQQLDPEKQAKLELEAEKLRQSGMKIGMQAQEMQDLRDNRESREELAKRAQYVKEIDNANRLELDKQRITAQNKGNNKPNS